MEESSCEQSGAMTTKTIEGGGDVSGGMEVERLEKSNKSPTVVIRS